MDRTDRTDARDKDFGGSLVQVYQRHLVPLIFETYAADLAGRLASRPLAHVLEVAAGTGVLTRALASLLPECVSIIATDLNPAMLDEAARVGTGQRPVQWRAADAMQLPFAGSTFDAVVCQFGVMFFPDKPRALSQARRVLRPGGVLLFSVWDHLQENEFADAVTRALGSAFAQDPPRFLARIPHGYHDRRTIEQDIAAAGFKNAARIATVAARSRAESAGVVATAYCEGTPLRHEIEARAPSRLGEATDIAAEAIAQRFGRGPVEGKIQAHIITVEN